MVLGFLLQSLNPFPYSQSSQKGPKRTGQHRQKSQNKTSAEEGVDVQNTGDIEKWLCTVHLSFLMSPGAALVPVGKNKARVGMAVAVRQALVAPFAISSNGAVNSLKVPESLLVDQHCASSDVTHSHPLLLLHGSPIFFRRCVIHLRLLFCLHLDASVIGPHVLLRVHEVGALLL
jgi:hypothetical protein